MRPSGSGDHDGFSTTNATSWPAAGGTATVGAARASAPTARRRAEASPPEPVGGGVGPGRRPSASTVDESGSGATPPPPRGRGCLRRRAPAVPRWCAGWRRAPTPRRVARIECVRVAEDVVRERPGAAVGRQRGEHGEHLGSRAGGEPRRRARPRGCSRSNQPAGSTTAGEPRACSRRSAQTRSRAAEAAARAAQRSKVGPRSCSTTSRSSLVASRPRQWPVVRATRADVPASRGDRRGRRTPPAGRLRSRRHELAASGPVSDGGARRRAGARPGRSAGPRQRSTAISAARVEWRGRPSQVKRVEVTGSSPGAGWRWWMAMPSSEAYWHHSWSLVKTASRSQAVKVPNSWARLAASTPANSSSSRMSRGQPAGAPSRIGVVRRDRRQHRQVQGDRALAGRQALEALGRGGLEALPVAVRELEGEPVPRAVVERLPQPCLPARRWRRVPREPGRPGPARTPGAPLARRRRGRRVPEQEGTSRLHRRGLLGVDLPREPDRRRRRPRCGPAPAGG